MLHCPRCRGRLPIWRTLRGDPPSIRRQLVGCPDCGALLEAQLWSVLLPVGAAALVAVGAGEFLQAVGKGLIVKLVGQLAALFVVAVPLCVALVRFRVRAFSPETETPSGPASAVRPSKPGERYGEKR